MADAAKQPAAVIASEKEQSGIIDMEHRDDDIVRKWPDNEKIWSDDSEEINEKAQLLEDGDIVEDMKNTQISVHKYTMKQIVYIILVILAILSIAATTTIINLQSNETNNKYQFVFVRHTESKADNLDLTEINSGVTNDGKQMLIQMHHWLNKEINRKIVLSDRSSQNVLFYSSYLARAQITAAFVYDALIPSSFLYDIPFKVIAILNEIVFGVLEMEWNVDIMTDPKYLSDKLGEIQSDEEKQVLLRYNGLKKIKNATEVTGQRKFRNLWNADKVIREFINYLKRDKDLSADKTVIIIGHSHWFAQFLKLYANDEKCENLHEMFFGIIKGMKQIKNTEIIKFELKWIDNGNNKENNVEVSNCHSVYKPSL